VGRRRRLGYPAAVPTLFDHAIAVLLAALFPVWGTTLGFRRLQRAAECDLPRVRRSVYRAAMALLWGLTAAVVAIWVASGRDFRVLGLVPVLSGGLLGTGLGLVVVVVYVLRERHRLLADREGLDLVRRRLHHIEAMMPRTPGDMRAFVALSITAGVCEEILYRGYLIWYFQHWLGVLPAAGLAAVLFGIGHAYQGPRGMALTGVVGAFLAAVYLLSGSLLVPVLLHALMDIHSGHLAYVAYAREDAERAARRVAWAAPPAPDGEPGEPAADAATPGADGAAADGTGLPSGESGHV